MDFATFLPLAVRDWVASMLDGNGSSWADGGWRQALQESRREVARLENLLRSVHDPDGLNNVRVELAKEREDCASLAENVSSLERLASRQEMQSVYERLATELGPGDNVVKFARAAWAAHMDYSTFRDRVKRAEAAAREVADAARALGQALARAEEVGTYLPLELFGVRALLRSTDHEPGHRNFAMWQGLRRSVLGEAQHRDKSADADDVPAAIKVVYVALSKATPVSPEEEARNMLQYAWGTAPGVRQLVGTIQRAAEEAIPAEDGAIGAALSSQKRNRKAEYLRGFATLLREQHDIQLSAEVMHAMATTATVILNDPDMAVSYDDVRKATKPTDR